jgi:DNA-binding response OmpR family regulator
MRILVVEDEKEFAHLIRRGLTEDGYAVDLAYDGVEGESLAESVSYDVIILDIVLPRKDGFQVCSSLRQKNIKTRILMLTGRDAVADRIRGLDCGADDYLIKPFDFGELTARIRALLRRDINRGSPLVQVGDISLNTANRQVKRGDQIIDLNNKEYAILEYLMVNADMVITRQMIEDHVWNFSLDANSNLVDVYISRLRTKLDTSSENSLIETVRGAGYRLRETL